jgi:hypothetical protein
MAMSKLGSRAEITALRYHGDMPKRSRKAPGDYNLNAARIVAIATGTEPPKVSKPAASAFGAHVSILRT